MTTLPPAVAAKVAGGHTFDNDPPAVISSVRRWTCTVCGDAVLDAGTNIYGSATERSCAEAVAFWKTHAGGKYWKKG